MISPTTKSNNPNKTNKNTTITNKNTTKTQKNPTKYKKTQIFSGLLSPSLNLQDESPSDMKRVCFYFVICIYDEVKSWYCADVMGLIVYTVTHHSYMI